MKLDLAFDAVFEQPNADPAAHDGPDDGPARTMWHVEDEGSPMTFAEVGRLVEVGRVQPSTMVWREGFATWERADEVEEINALFVAPPIPQRQRQRRATEEALSALVEAELKRDDDDDKVRSERHDENDVTLTLSEAPSASLPTAEEVRAFAPRVAATATSHVQVRTLALAAVAVLVIASAIALGVVLAVSFMRPLPSPAPTVFTRDGVAYVVDAAGNAQPLAIAAPAPAPAPSPAPAPAPAPVAPLPPAAEVVAAGAGVATSAEPQVPQVPQVPKVAPKVPKPKPPAATTSCDADLGLGCGSTKAERVELTPKDVLVVARKNLGSIRACGERYSATGLARVGWRVLPNGKAVDVKHLDGLGNTPTGACVAAAIQSWQFPTSTKETVVKSLPLPFK